MSVLELSVVLMLLFWIALALAVYGFAAVLTKAATPAGQVLATSMWTALWRPLNGLSTRGMKPVSSVR